MVGKLSQSRTSDEDKSWHANHWDEVQGKEHHEFNHLLDAPWGVDSRRRGLSQHLNGIRGIKVAYAVRKDHVVKGQVNQSRLP